MSQPRRFFGAAALLLSFCACTCGSKQAENTPSQVAVTAPAVTAQPPAPAPAPAAAPAPATVAVDITTSPAGAEVSVDGVVVGRSPVHLERPRSADVHEVTASLDGRERAQKKITFENAQALDLSLPAKPVKAAVIPAAAPAPAAPAAAGTAADPYKLEDLKDPYAK